MELVFSKSKVDILCGHYSYRYVFNQFAKHKEVLE
jgi:hypothetical protein